MVLADSSGAPMRPTGWAAAIARRISSACSPVSTWVTHVSMPPGHTQLTRMPCWAHSSAAERVRLMTPALAALYAAMPQPPAVTDTDAVFTTTPWPWRPHDRQVIFQAQEHAGQCHREDAIPALERTVHQRPRFAATGVVAEHVDAAVAVECQLYGRPYFDRISGVHLDPDGGAAVGDEDARGLGGPQWRRRCRHLRR